MNSQYPFPHRTQVIGKRDAGAEGKRSGRGGSWGCVLVFRRLIQFPPDNYGFVLFRRSSPPKPIQMEKSDEYEDHTQLTDGIQQGECYQLHTYLVAQLIFGEFLYSFAGIYFPALIICTKRFVIFFTISPISFYMNFNFTITSLLGFGRRVA